MDVRLRYGRIDADLLGRLVLPRFGALGKGAQQLPPGLRSNSRDVLLQGRTLRRPIVTVR
jgi:hypothetical protein